MRSEEVILEALEGLPGGGAAPDAGPDAGGPPKRPAMPAAAVGLAVVLRGVLAFNEAVDPDSVARMRSERDKRPLLGPADLAEDGPAADQEAGPGAEEGAPARVSALRSAWEGEGPVPLFDEDGTVIPPEHRRAMEWGAKTRQALRNEVGRFVALRAAAQSALREGRMPDESHLREMDELLGSLGGMESAMWEGMEMEGQEKAA